MHVGKATAAGALVGAGSGLVGAGGGFLVVPALVLVGGLPMRRAIGTSLFVISIQSIAGFAGHATHTHVPILIVAVVTAAALAGAGLGARFVHRVPTGTLRRGFGWLVLGMAVFVLVKELVLGGST
jgi:uncharacterized membrane protein YfcA